MQYNVEVKRISFSTTQGEAAVYINGEKIEQYGDKIELVDGKWQSTIADEVFIVAAFRKIANI